MYEAFHKVFQAPDVKVKCTNADMGGAHHSFQAVLARMERSIFCLALPGDAPSTRRLSEIFMAGLPCIRA